MSKAKEKRIAHRIEPARGYALRVGGLHPYVVHFRESLGNPHAKEQVEAMVSEDYQSCVAAVVIPAAEYRRILALERGTPNPNDQRRPSRSERGNGGR